MPHRVTTFFRNHSSNASDQLKAELKKAAKRDSSNRRPSFSTRTPSSSSSSFSDGASVKMPDTLAHKRMSITLPGKHSSPRNSATKIPHQPASLDCAMESPPLVFYGSTTSSSGALMSGQLLVRVEDENFAVEDFKMELAIEVTRKKPFHSHCAECSSTRNVLTTWKFLQTPLTLSAGKHQFPFSYLLQGHLPASMKGALTTIEYVLRATVTLKVGEPIKLTHVLDVKRAIYPSEQPRNSVRIFPPTNLTANVQLPSVLHPIGESMISMRVDGVVKRNVDTKTQTHWRLKRVLWRLDETQKMIAPACDKHAAKLGNIEDAKKGLAHQDVRCIGTHGMKSGWKTDHSTPDGSIEIEFPIGIDPDSKPLCDLKAEDGTVVSHTLVVEMIVLEEYAPLRNPRQVTPTGAARVLRMHFDVTLTERAGMGISWDEEQPPLYENVPASPPKYGNTELILDEPIPEGEALALPDALDDIRRPIVTNGVSAFTSAVGPSSSSSSPAIGPSAARLSIEDLETEPN